MNVMVRIGYSQRSGLIDSLHASSYNNRLPAWIISKHDVTNVRTAGVTVLNELFLQGPTNVTLEIKVQGI